jgi:hypothetical protein
MSSPSHFAGLFNASDFAYGINKTTPALQVIGGPNTTSGAQALQLAFGYTQTNDGLVFNPLNTNAPIIVGGNSSTETVTPSAVSNSTPTIYSSSSVTSTFAYLHGNGDSIRSGTAGLQEALNVAGAAAGGTVIVDAGWTGLGGTTAMIAAATIPSGVKILDNRGGFAQSPLLATLTLTNAQILALEATPIQVIAAPGAGSLIQVLGWALENLNTGTAYVNGGAIELTYGSGGGLAAATVAATFLTSPTATETITANGGSAAAAGTASVNEGIFITNATAPFITGTGTMKVWISYNVLSGF